MVLKVSFSTAALLLSSALYAGPDLSGFPLLNLPDSESESMLTAEGLRMQNEYDLLVDDPSLYCVPASMFRSI